MTLQTMVVIFLTVLQLYDGWTTYQIVEKFGGVETNRLILRIEEKVGSLAGALVITKGLAIVLVWALLAFSGTLRDAALFLVTLVYVWVCYNNYRVYRKLK